MYEWGPIQFMWCSKKMLKNEFLPLFILNTTFKFHVHGFPCCWYQGTWNAQSFIYITELNPHSHTSKYWKASFAVVQILHTTFKFHVHGFSCCSYQVLEIPGHSYTSHNWIPLVFYFVNGTQNHCLVLCILMSNCLVYGHRQK